MARLQTDCTSRLVGLPNGNANGLRMGLGLGLRLRLGLS